MKILIIDNTLDPESWGSSDIRRLATLGFDSTLVVRRAPERDLPKDPKAFDRIIVSGSKTSALDNSDWVKYLLEFIRKTVEAQHPYLGICYGHQILARAINGIECVRQAAIPEFGWTKIHILEPSTLLEGISQSFYTFSSHYDEVSCLPSGMRRLAYSDACSVQACQLEDLPIFGIQFHPEKSLIEAEKSLRKTKENLSHPKLLNPNRGEKLYDPEIGKILFKNFLEMKKV